MVKKLLFAILLDANDPMFSCLSTGIIILSNRYLHRPT